MELSTTAYSLIGLGLIFIISVCYFILLEVRFKTPAQKRGLVEGNTYYVEDQNISGGHRKCIAKLTNDDGTSIPYFKVIQNIDGFYHRKGRITLVNLTEATIKELTDND